jgi:geranylgeranyl diphosphate synthase type I
MEILPEPVRDDLDLCRRFFKESLLRIEDVDSGDVSRELRDILRLEAKPPLLFPDLAEKMARHLVRMEGKWFRAALAILSAHLCGTAREMSVPVGAALEMIHLATLIHDDIIDQGDRRRGQASLPFLRGPAVSVLMGDLLHAKAMRILSETGNGEIVLRLSEAVYQVCLGEISQHQFSPETPPTESEYLQVVRRKTGALIAASAFSGAVLGEKNDLVISNLREFGFNVGIAFQISDDILDVTAPDDELGKRIGTDLENGYITLPLIHALRTAGEGSALGPFPGEEGTAPPVLLERLEETGSLTYAREVASRFIERAKKVLEAIPLTPGMDRSMLGPLTALADFVADRSR